MPYAACQWRIAHLPGLSGPVDIIDAFCPTCREFGRWLMYNTAYSCIKAMDRRIGQLQRPTLGRHGRHLGPCATLLHISPDVMGIYV